MAKYCQPCDRYFGGQRALQQHLNSPAHHIFECDECDRSFDSQQALNQHINSPAHIPVYECDECDRSFSSQQSLDQHLNSPAYAPVYECDGCDRTFGNSSLSTSTSTPQLMPRCTSVMSATGGSAVLKLSNSTTSPYLTPL